MRSSPPVTTRADALAHVQRAVAQRQELGQTPRRAGAQAPRGVLGEPPHDQPGERRRQDRQVLGPDVVAAVEHRRHELVEHLGLLAQELGGPRDVALGRRMQRAQGRDEAVPRTRARVRRRTRWTSPRARTARATGSAPRSPRGSHRAAAARAGRPPRASRAARAGPATPRAGRAPSRPGRSSCARSRPARRGRSRGRAAAPSRWSRAQAWRFPVRGAGPDRSTTSSTPSAAVSSRQCASSPSDSSPRRPWLTWSATTWSAPAMRTATSSRQTESRPPLSSTTTGAPGGRSPVART